MMNIDNWLGKSTVLTGRSAAVWLEASVSEGFQSLTGLPLADRPNLFNRPVNSRISSDLRFGTGLAASGLRTGAFLEGPALSENHQNIIKAGKNHLPWVIFASTQMDPRGQSSDDFSPEDYQALADTGSFQLFASNAQEVLDFGIVAHKIAELSLIPGLVGMDGLLTAFSAQSLDIPTRNELLQFLGNPDDTISSPTPAQEMIFGKLRRRVPNWYNFDYPTLIGSAKDGIAGGLQIAANHQFFHEHLPELVERVLEEYGNLSGRTYSSIGGYRSDDAKYLILTQGANFEKVATLVDYFRARNKKVGCLNLRSIRPFPLQQLIKHVSGKKGITVLERVSRPMAGAAPIFQEVLANCHLMKDGPARVYSGVFGSGGLDLSYEDIGRAFENMMKKGEGQPHFYLGIDFIKKSSSFPRQEILLQNIKREYPGIQEGSLSEPSEAQGFQPDGSLSLKICFEPQELNLGEMAEESLGLVSELFRLGVKGFPDLHRSGYLMNLSDRSHKIIPEKADHLDGMIASLSCLRSNKKLIDSLGTGAYLVIISSDQESFTVELSSQIRKKKLSVHLLNPEEDRDWKPTLQGTLVKLISELSGDNRDNQKILESIGDYYRRHFDPLPDEILASISYGLSSLTEPLDLPQGKPVPEIGVDLPYTVRQYADQGPPYSRLSDFYTRVGHLYQTGQADQLMSDPLQAIAAIPASTANFADQSGLREKVPNFKPSNCTACGSCYIHCPHSAIPPLVIGVESMIRGAAQIAASRGLNLSQLTPVIKNLALLTNQIIRDTDHPGSKASDFLMDGFNRLVDKMKLEGEKLDQIRQDFDIVVNILADYPVAVTDPYFSKPEAIEKGSGELFSLSVDPMACTGCGVCVEVCPEDALDMVVQSAGLLEKLTSDFNLWEQLPDTSGETVSRMLQDPDYDSFAAVLLSRNFYTSISGGEASDQRMGSKVMLHLVTAAIESIMQPRVLEFTQDLKEIIGTLSENIHTILSDALPRDDFQKLSKALDQSDENNVPLDHLVGALGSGEHLKLVDARDLQRKIDLVSSLRDLYWTLTEGPSGTGRSRYGMVISSREAFSWSMRYPYNVFSSPIMVEADPNLVLGLFKGHLRHQLDNMKLLRRARMEVKDKYVPEIMDAEVASLTWDQLDDKEKAVIPPVLLVGNRKWFMEEASASIDLLLGSGFPVKMIILDDCMVNWQDLADGRLDYLAHHWFGAGFFKNGMLLQSSLAFSNNLFKGLQEGIHTSRPALLHLLAPDRSKHQTDFDAWAQLPGLAAKTRTFPDIHFKSKASGGYLASSVDLSGNPSLDSDWVTEDLLYLEGDEEKDIAYTYTYADWAFSQTGLRNNFQPAQKTAGSLTPVADYLALDEAGRTGRVPVIRKIGEDRRLQSFTVSSSIVSATERIRLNWRTLKEIAGILTEFPQKLRHQVEQDMKEEQEQALANLKSEYENKLKAQEQEQLELVKKKLKERLLALSGFNK